MKVDRLNRQKGQRRKKRKKRKNWEEWGGERDGRGVWGLLKFACKMSARQADMQPYCALRGTIYDIHWGMEGK